MYKRVLFTLLIVVTACSGSSVKTVSQGDYRIEYNLDNGRAELFRGDSLLFSDWTTEFNWNGKVVPNVAYSRRAWTEKAIEDQHGKGIMCEIKHSEKGLPDLLQRFYIYSSLPYILTETELVSDTVISTEYMAPVVAKTFYEDSDKMLFVPFDNDKWVQYDVFPAGEGTSYEATALYSPVGREGRIVGSVEHDNWKSAVQTEQLNGKNIRLRCFGGITSTLTRDALPHGKVKGLRVKSPKILVGAFSDWRTGMEEYARANNRQVPGRKWESPVPFGWNSWGSIQTNIRLENANEVSDFFKEHLQSASFQKAPVYIGLDSYWDNFSDAELKQFVEHCRKNGQEAGIYWAPFVDWARNPDRKVEGTDVPYSEVYLYANGQPQELDGAWAVDPTHPAVKKRMDVYLSRFKNAGFKYIKIDFITHGSLEADVYADSAVTTGMQAYNAGMKYLTAVLGDDFYITQAISPLFPSNYAHSRRIACDAFASMSDTEYTLNGLSYGWWLDNAYVYNDPDHLVLWKEEESEGENRARITSGVITGIVMLGDDLSRAGSPEAKKRVEEFFGNEAVLAVAQSGCSFRPVYGYRPSEKRRSEQFFMSDTGKSVYVALFNFEDKAQTINLPLTDLGLEAGKSYPSQELWHKQTFVISDTLSVSLRPKDAVLFEIKK